MNSIENDIGYWEAYKWSILTNVDTGSGRKFLFTIMATEQDSSLWSIGSGQEDDYLFQNEIDWDNIPDYAKRKVRHFFAVHFRNYVKEVCI